MTKKLGESNFNQPSNVGQDMPHDMQKLPPGDTLKISHVVAVILASLCLAPFTLGISLLIGGYLIYEACRSQKAQKVYHQTIKPHQETTKTPYLDLEEKIPSHEDAVNSNSSATENISPTGNGVGNENSMNPFYEQLREQQDDDQVKDDDQAKIENEILSTRSVPCTHLHPLLTLYSNGGQGWIMVPPRDELSESYQFQVFVGAVGFEGVGEWKIHVSIDPDQMEQAIPIILQVIHDENAPRCGFKIATKALLNNEHQIGKEIALIFSAQDEKNNFPGIQACLTRLWHALHNADIRPEKGLVLTPQTMDQIAKAPEGQQSSEKRNLETGKFDRAIPCPQGVSFFHYRSESCIPILDSTWDDSWCDRAQGMIKVSEILRLAKTTPEKAHNPLNKNDPYIKLVIA